MTENPSAVRYDLDRHERSTPDGTVSLLPPGVPHNGSPATSDGFRKRVLYLDMTQLDASLAAHLVNALEPLGWVLGLNGVILLAYLVAVGAAESGRPTLMFLTKEAVRLVTGSVARGTACEGCPSPHVVSRSG